MSILTDAGLALFASIGIWTLGRWALEWLMDGRERAGVWTVVCIHGGAYGLEQTVQGLLRRPYGRGVLLVDCGLNREGRSLAAGVAEQEQNVWFCRWDQTGTWMKEADVWTTQKSAMK